MRPSSFAFRSHVQPSCFSDVTSHRQFPTACLASWEPLFLLLFSTNKRGGHNAFSIRAFLPLVPEYSPSSLVFLARNHTALLIHFGGTSADPPLSILAFSLSLTRSPEEKAKGNRISHCQAPSVGRRLFIVDDNRRRRRCLLGLSQKSRQTSHKKQARR